jgi:hypothetical protein
MLKKENPKTRLKNYWVDIVLTTVSIVQGFDPTPIY